MPPAVGHGGRHLIGDARMALEFTPLHPLFAAEVGGIDLRRPLDEATVAALDAAMDRYALLVFRDQPMT
ncbi:MAG: TauD/TfdA family dioxygenase, partial [Phycisphaerae bacterium]